MAMHASGVRTAIQAFGRKDAYRTELLLVRAQKSGSTTSLSFFMAAKDESTRFQRRLVKRARGREV
jgi:hypothetical protein